MKKLYAILLGLALVLGMATIASAYDLKVTGEFEGIATWNTLNDPTWCGLDFDAANLYVDLKGALGDNATGELKVGFDVYKSYSSEFEGEYFFINLAKWQYNITDNFFAGLQAAQRNDGKWGRFYNSSVTSGEGFSHSIGSIYFESYVNVFAGFNFDGGSVMGYSDLYPEDPAFYVQGSYAADALTAKAWISSYDGDVHFVGKVGYNFSDNFNLTGGVASNDGDVYAGLWGFYTIEDLVKFKAYLEYDVQPFYNNDYYLLVTLLALGEDFQPFLEWDEDDGISIGADYYMGDADLWCEYWFDDPTAVYPDDATFQVGIDIVF